jgi:hypothetical protein
VQLFLTVKSWIRKVVKRHPLGALLFFNALLISLTGLFTVIALGPDSQLMTPCDAGQGCIKSHGEAAVWAIVCGVLTALCAGLTVWAIGTGRLNAARDQGEDDV